MVGWMREGTGDAELPQPAAGGCGAQSVRRQEGRVRGVGDACVDRRPWLKGGHDW